MKKLIKLLSNTTSLLLISTVVSCSNEIKLKNSLSKITNLTGINLIIDITENYNVLNNQIIEANEFKEHPIESDYLIYYYYLSTTTTDMAINKQGSGAQYIVIEASTEDNYWYGKTPRIKITSIGLK